MKLDKVTLQNFRCYEALSVDLHPQLTVLVADNGAGKTTILDALRIGLWPYVKGFDLAQETLKKNLGAELPLKQFDLSFQINQSDIRLEKHFPENGRHVMVRQLPVMLEFKGQYNQSVKTWMLSLNDESGGAEIQYDDSADKLSEWAKLCQKKARNLQDAVDILPIVTYFGVARGGPTLSKYSVTLLPNQEGQHLSDVWIRSVNQAARKVAGTIAGASKAQEYENYITRHTRTYAYNHSLAASADFSQFESWFIDVYEEWNEFRINNIEADNSAQAVSAARQLIDSIQQAINTVLKPTGWQNLEYSRQQGKALVLHHDSQGVMDVRQLSEGVRNTVALVADIAYRCTLLNGHLGADAVQKSPGIVMIDEVDMHLHPRWQQTIINSLLEAFPKIQFIVTTHSPQVLSTVPSECVRILEDGAVRVPALQTQGLPSADVLAGVQSVDPVPDISQSQWLSEYKALIQQYQHESESGLSLRKKLEEHFGAGHPAMLECERLIRLMAMKKKLPSKKAG